MNFMFCCIDVNYVRNPKQEVNIFCLKRKRIQRSRNIHLCLRMIFSGKKDMYTNVHFCYNILHVCLPEKNLYLADLSFRSYVVRNAKTGQLLTPFHLAKVPFGPLVPFLLKIGSLLTLMDAGFGDLIWGGRANRLDLRGRPVGIL